MGLFLWFAWLSFISNILIYCITSLLARLRLSPLLLSWIVVNEKLDREKHKSPRKTLATVVLASCRSFLFAWEFCKCCLLTSKSWHHLCSTIVVGHWEPTTKSRTPSMVFEIHRKSLIQQCERSEQRLHYEWTKVTKRMKTWSLQSTSVTRQVSFDRTNIGSKCQNSNVTFWVIFKQCAF